MADGIAPREPGSDDLVTAPPPRKRRRLGWVIAVVVLAVVLVVGFPVAESVARSSAEQYVRDQVRTVLALPDDQEPAVSIGPGSVLLQAVRGTIDSIDVSVERVIVGELTGDVSLTATDVPLDSTKPLTALALTFAIAEDDLQSLTGLLDDVDLTSVRLADDKVEIGSEFALFGLTLPVAVLLEATAVDGQLSLDPSSISVNGNEISVADLRAGLLGGLAEQILAARTICVAGYLPAALTVTDVTISGDRLMLEFRASGVALGGDEFTTMGICP